MCYNQNSLFQLVAMNIYWKQALGDVPWNQFNSENIEILYLLSALKEPVQIDCKKNALLWNKHEYQHSAVIFVKNIFNSFPDTVLFLYFLKYIRKPEVYWYFQGALKESSAIKWVKSHLIFTYLFCYLFK